MKNSYLLLLAVLFFSCTTVKRYKSIKSSSLDNNNLVTVDIFGTKVEATKEEDNSKSLWDLNAEGQAEFIKTLSTRNPDNDKFSTSLNSKYLKPKDKQVTDYTSKDLKMIFSIGKKRDYTNIDKTTSTYTLADRIEYLSMKITIPSSIKLKFLKWNKFITEYGSVDIAGVTFNKSFEATAGMGISNSFTRNKTGENRTTSNVNGFTPEISSTGTISNSETQNVKYRYVSLNGKLNDKEIMLEQEGMREIDLNGNIVIDVNLKFDETPETLSLIEGYKTATGTYNTPDKLKMILYTAMVPVVAGLPTSIDAKLEYKYAYRHVAKGEDTFYEWDDVVEYKTGTAEKTITLFTKQDYQKNYVPDFYNISRIGEDATTANNRTRIAVIDSTTSIPYEMIFSSLASAREFWEWLVKYTPATADMDKPIVLNTFQLTLRSDGNDTPLTKRLLETNLHSLDILKYYR